jgi:hypothetical protein
VVAAGSRRKTHAAILPKKSYKEFGAVAGADISVKIRLNVKAAPAGGHHTRFWCGYDSGSYFRLIARVAQLRPGQKLWSPIFEVSKGAT